MIRLLAKILFERTFGVFDVLGFIIAVPYLRDDEFIKGIIVVIVTITISSFVEAWLKSKGEY